MNRYEVDIDLANEAKREMSKVIDAKDHRLLNRVGAFSALFQIDLNRYEEPLLVLKTEEPGSKQLIAAKYNKIENVCHDMINHLVNDCIVMGAEPLTVQDAIICGKLDKDIVTRIVKAISEACARNSCVLTGGETSEQPNVLQEGVYILTSSIVGIVDKKNVIDGSKIHESDIVIAIPSNGIHTNGYTLVRTIMRDHPEIINEKIDGISFIDAILEPHCAYYNVLRDLFPQQIFHGLAHITGGGICENLNRILPEGMDALIDLASYNMPKVFKLLKQYGEIDDREMLRTFNLGVGIAAVVSPEDVNTVFNHCKKYGLTCFPIGRIIRGNRQVKLKNALEWR